MSKKHRGAQSVAFEKPVYLIGRGCVGGVMEGKGPLARHFDILASDALWGEDSFEKAERKFFFEAAKKAIEKGKKSFDKDRIIAFLNEKGIALFDTAMEIIRHKGNASDQFLEVVTPVDLKRVLVRIPACRAIVTTGQKATDTLLEQIDAASPRVGGYSEFVHEGRPMRLYRMPSSSRAYPKPLEEKAADYRVMFHDLDMLYGDEDTVVYRGYAERLLFAPRFSICTGSGKRRRAVGEIDRSEEGRDRQNYPYARSTSRDGHRASFLLAECQGRKPETIHRHILVGSRVRGVDTVRRQGGSR